MITFLHRKRVNLPPTLALAHAQESGWCPLLAPKGI